MAALSGGADLDGFSALEVDRGCLDVADLDRESEEALEDQGKGCRRSRSTIWCAPEWIATRGWRSGCRSRDWLFRRRMDGGEQAGNGAAND